MELAPLGYRHEAIQLPVHVQAVEFSHVYYIRFVFCYSLMPAFTLLRTLHGLLNTV